MNFPRICRMSIMAIIAFGTVALAGCSKSDSGGPVAGGGGNTGGGASGGSSAGNLHDIGLALMQYSNDHKGPLAPDLGTLVKEEGSMVEISVFLLPEHKGNLPSNVATMTSDEKAAWVNANSDYTYLGAGKVQGGPSELAIACEKVAKNGQINILFGDFHVESMAEGAAQKAIGLSKGYKQ